MFAAAFNILTGTGHGIAGRGNSGNSDKGESEKKFHGPCFRLLMGTMGIMRRQGSCSASLVLECE